jgi:hypothetical protein
MRWASQMVAVLGAHRGADDRSVDEGDRKAGQAHPAAHVSLGATSSLSMLRRTSSSIARQIWSV